MQEIHILERLKEINVSIGKTMFAMTKTQEIKNPPSPLQFKILNYLLDHKTSCVYQKELEEKLNVSKATISEALFTMEKNGVIIRTSSQTDARSKTIKLTDMSLKRFEEMDQISKKINKELTKNIKEEDIAIFLSVLDSMKNNLHELRKEKKC